MNKTALKSLLATKKKSELIEILMDLHTKNPRMRQEIDNIVNPPKIDWEKLYDDCMDKVIVASTSNKLNQLDVPSLSLGKFTEFSPEKDIAMEYMFESFEILVKGLLFLSYTDSFNYSWVGGYGGECRTYMKKRHWLDSDVDLRMEQIVHRYFKPNTDAYKYVLFCADVIPNL